MNSDPTIQEYIEFRIREAIKYPLTGVVTPTLRAALMTEVCNLYRASVHSSKDLHTRIICDSTNNSEEDIKNGIINIEVIPPPTIVFKATVTKDGIKVHP